MSLVLNKAFGSIDYGEEVTTMTLRRIILGLALLAAGAVAFTGTIAGTQQQAVAGCSSSC
jgi:hypothetical protein